MPRTLSPKLGEPMPYSFGYFESGLCSGSVSSLGCNGRHPTTNKPRPPLKYASDHWISKKKNFVATVFLSIVQTNVVVSLFQIASSLIIITL